MEKPDIINTLISTYGYDDQRTNEWYSKRNQMLTASEIYKALPNATPAARHELIMSKLVPRVENTNDKPRALVWGTRLEPIAKEIYTLNHGGKIVDVTCIPHPSVSFLGASPDGIILMEEQEHERHGRLIEIKCPISRKFDADTPVPVGYFHQMQLQMECTSLKECEYVEFGFREVQYPEWVDSTIQKGFYVVHDDDKQVKYRKLDDPRDIFAWRKEELGDECGNWNNVFWVLEKFHTRVVPHDENWLAENLESFKKVWEEIETHRTNGTLPEHPKEKTTLTLTL